MIIVNGAPKSGTHAIMACLETLGLTRQPGCLRVLYPRKRLRIKKVADGPDIEPLEVATKHGNDRFLHAHVHAKARVPSAQIFVLRDPRNVAVSYMRYQENDEECGRRPSASALAAVLKTNYYGCPLVDLYRSFLGWRIRSKVLTVRFEDLVNDETMARDRIAGWLGRTTFNRHHGFIGTATPTWSGRLSDWRDFWSPEVDRVWRSTGGHELLAEIGYPAD